MFELLFRSFCYILLGFGLEVVFVALSKIVDGKIRGRDIYLEGHTYLWMAPVYGILLLFVFEPVHSLITNWFILARWLVWAISFTFFEGLSGYCYDKLLGFCPWDYSTSKWKVFKRGYTKWTLLPLWGLAGLGLELSSKVIIGIAPTAVKIIKITMQSILS